MASEPVLLTCTLILTSIIDLYIFRGQITTQVICSVTGCSNSGGNVGDDENEKVCIDKGYPVIKII